MSGRPMKYPYTFSAKIAQFPFKYFYNNNWVFRYHLYGVGLTAVVYYYITKQVNSPAYVAKHLETQRKMKEKEAAARHH